jgi:crossover junction endodeoxyribonuclease RuvC
MPRIIRYYMGIDPGKSGGIAIIDGRPFIGSGYPIVAEKMPSTERDIFDCVNSVDCLRTKALIERVHSMPRQGVSSTFRFGVGYGGLRMALIASKISFQEVNPRSWQSRLGIPPRKGSESKPAFKNRLRAKAQQLFPRLDLWGKTKGEQLAVCDALLIAEVCRRGL